MCFCFCEKYLSLNIIFGAETYKLPEEHHPKFQPNLKAHVQFQQSTQFFKRSQGGCPTQVYSITERLKILSLMW